MSHSASVGSIRILGSAQGHEAIFAPEPELLVERVCISRSECDKPQIPHLFMGQTFGHQCLANSLAAMFWIDHHVANPGVSRAVGDDPGKSHLFTA